jgi:hypothetical protein
MAKLEGSGGGTVGKLWRKHGGGYYALLAIGTFVYLEFVQVVQSVAGATSIQDYLTSELFTFLIDTLLNTFWASFWPLSWYRASGVEAIYWVVGGYVVWTVLIAIALARREKQMQKELGL